MRTSWTLGSLDTPIIRKSRNDSSTGRKPSIFSPEQSIESSSENTLSKQSGREEGFISDNVCTTKRQNGSYLQSNNDENVSKHLKTRSEFTFNARQHSSSPHQLDQTEVSIQRKNGPELSNYGQSDNVLNTDEYSSRERESISRDPANERLLSVFFSSGKLGAALFNVEDSCLSLLQDIPEISPEFELLSSLVYQVEPNHILVSARQGSELLDKLTILTGHKANSSHSTDPESCDIRDDAQDVANRNINLIIRPSIEYNPTSCKRRVFNTDLPENTNLSEQELHIRSAMYFDNGSDNMMRAAGALLKYLDKNHAVGLMDMDDSRNTGLVQVAQIDKLVLEELLTLDEFAFPALQIFSSSSQLSGSRAGSWNKKREGFSLFNMFNRCRSYLGSSYMRHILRCPVSNIEMILRRQQAIEFFTSPSQIDLVKAFQHCLKDIRNVPSLLKKMATEPMRLQVSDWRCIYSSVKALVNLSQLSMPCQDRAPILSDICGAVNKEVYDLLGLMDEVFDLESSLSAGEFKVKPGVDKNLDDKRRLYNGLPDIMRTIAEQEVNSLPNFLESCVISYIPSLGYHLCAPRSRQEEDIDYTDIPGLTFEYETDAVLYFKTERCIELDKSLGDVCHDILTLEVEIMSKVTTAFHQRRDSLMVAVKLSGQLDCLVAMSLVSIDNNWSQPKMVESGPLVITGGRHPLQELSLNQFIPNDTLMDSSKNSVHILTGPNSSGKSVYLKQVGLIVYLAHLGCWVPASKATIPITNKIFTRIQTVESVSLGISSFACDVNQISQALRSCTSRSLLLIDEFGKGTNAIDGEALLAAVVQNIASREKPPSTIISTHFHQVQMLLGPESGCSYFIMETQFNGNDLLYLHKLKEGFCSKSEAGYVASKAGLKSDIVKRAEEIVLNIRTGDILRPSQFLLDMDEYHELSREFLAIDIGDETNDLEELFKKIINGNKSNDI